MQLGQDLFFWNHSSRQFAWKECPHFVIQSLFIDKHIVQFVYEFRIYWLSNESSFFHSFDYPKFAEEFICYFLFPWSLSLYASSALLLQCRQVTKSHKFSKHDDQHDLLEKTQQKQRSAINPIPPKMPPIKAPKERSFPSLHLFTFYRLKIDPSIFSSWQHAGRQSVSV